MAPLPAELRPAPPAADQPVPPDDPARSSKTAEPDPDWHPTENPKSTLVPGQMRSDREEVPAPFTKEDADKAEIAEARLRSSRSLTASSCQVYWPSWFQVCGAIRDKYNSLGGPASFLSYPTSGNILNPGGTGERVTFANGPIYWSAATGAHPVVNSFLNRWGIHGYEAGWLKYPTTDEVVLPDGGRRQEFQEGAIYVAFQNAIGSAIRNGPLRDKYNAVGGLAPGGTLLGYPIQDQIGLPDGQGQMDRFERGVIYWHPTTGAYTIHGEILDRWADSGYESGAFGYPTSEQITDANDRFKQQFQHGEIETYTLFEGQFEWEDTAGVIKWCHFRGRTDRVHYSTSVINNVPVKDTASAHVWWEAIKDCKPMTTATVTAQLQSKNSAGEWVNRGAEKVEHSVYPGGGSANRAAANDKCIGFAPTTWRVVGDVDINGSPDAPDLTYGEPRIGFECG
ncbi:LGFP repeat-containing protein [Rhodococcus ruber]